MCVAQTRVLFLSLSGGMGDLCLYKKSLPTILERINWMVCLRGCTKQCHFCPKLADFLFTHLVLDWVGTLLVFIILLFLLFLESHHLHNASNHLIISKSMCHFYLEQCPSHKQFDPWDVKCLLSLLETCAAVSASLADSVSLVSFLQAGDCTRVSTQASH